MRVLIVRLSSVGDVVHAMPVVQDLRAVRPGVRIDWVVEPAFAPLVRRVDGVHAVIEAQPRRWRRHWWTAATRAEWRLFRERLRRDRYDAVVDLQGLTRSALIAHLARGVSYGPAHRTEGASFEVPARWLLDRPLRLPPRIHPMDRSREIAARALGYPVPALPHYGLRTNPPPPGPRTVVLVHGSSRVDRLWVEARWHELAQRLVAEGWRVALPRAGSAESARARRLAAALGEACEVWPEMALDALLDRMAGAQGVIGVDSGPSHMAVALGLPHVQLHNVAGARRNGPQRSHGRAHQLSLEGRGQPAPDVDAVWQAWQQVLRAPRA